MDLPAVPSYPSLFPGLPAILGVVSFAFHVWLYFAFLKP